FRSINLGEYVFGGCSSLRSIFFNGNAPTAKPIVFASEVSGVSIYYFPRTSGWTDSLGGVMTLLWDPVDQFGYSTSNNVVVIRSYLGPGGSVTIPARIDGLPVAAIGGGAFQFNTNLAVIIFPDSITIIASNAFAGCGQLFGVVLSSNLTSIGG